MQHFLTKSILAGTIALLVSSCTEERIEPDYREQMRQFVISISEKGEALKPGFIVIPQNGMELLTSEGGGNGTVSNSYINAIDACGQEELFYGYDNQNNFLSEN